MLGPAAEPQNIRSCRRRYAALGGESCRRRCAFSIRLGHMVSDEILDLLEHLSSECDPGPWRASVEGRDHEAGDDFIQTGPDDDRRQDIYVTRDSGPASAVYLDFIALSRTHLPALIAEVRVGRAANR
jgi:hypothetical protein